jgi:hypothetical protein
MNKKYKLTKNTKKVNGVTLYQIQALKDFLVAVKKFEKGVEKAFNI